MGPFQCTICFCKWSVIGTQSLSLLPMTASVLRWQSRIVMIETEKSKTFLSQLLQEKLPYPCSGCIHILCVDLIKTYVQLISCFVHFACYNTHTSHVWKRYKNCLDLHDNTVNNSEAKPEVSTSWWQVSRPCFFSSSVSHRKITLVSTSSSKRTSAIRLFDPWITWNIKSFHSPTASFLTIDFLPRSPAAPEPRLRDPGIIRQTPHSHEVRRTLQRKLRFPAPVQNLVPFHNGAILSLAIKRKTWKHSHALLETGLARPIPKHMPTATPPCVEAWSIPNQPARNRP